VSLFLPLVLVGILLRGFDSKYWMFGELKILGIVFIPLGFEFLFSYLKLKDVNFIIGTKITIWFYFLLLGFRYVAFGQLRLQDQFGFSIYVSYCFTVLAVATSLGIGIFPKLAVMVIDLLLGSRTGLVAFVISISLSAKTLFGNLVRLAIGAPIVLGLAFVYSSQVRGQDLSDTENLDRVNLVNGTREFIDKEFKTLDWLIGYGPGKEMKGFTTHSGLDYFVDVFAPDGVYSYVVHNEYLRLFLDFGLVGIILILIYLGKKEPYFLIPILIAMLTNSILYCSHFLVVYGMAMYYRNNRTVDV
jgi:hypothetical protein